MFFLPGRIPFQPAHGGLIAPDSDRRSIRHFLPVLLVSSRACGLPASRVVFACPDVNWRRSFTTILLSTYSGPLQALPALDCNPRPRPEVTRPFDNMCLVPGRSTLRGSGVRETLSCSTSDSGDYSIRGCSHQRCDGRGWCRGSRCQSVCFKACPQSREIVCACQRW